MPPVAEHDPTNCACPCHQAPPPPQPAANPAYLQLEQRPVSRRATVIWVALVTLLVALIAGATVRDILDRSELPGQSQDQGTSSMDSREVDVSHLEVGDCVYDFVTTQQQTTLPEVPCDQPHKGEVVGQFRPTGPFPGELQIPDGVDEHCRRLFRSYAPNHSADRGFDVAFSLASRRQWSDDRYRFTCVATDFTFRTGKLTDPAPPSPPSN